VSIETPQLIRLSELLAEREVPVLPVLSALKVPGTSFVYLAISTLSRRIDLLVPFSVGALAEVAPTAVAPAIPPRAMLRICCDGDRLGAAMVVVGTIAPGEAIDDVAPPTTREAWVPIVESMAALANGKVTSRTRFFTESRGAIVVGYSAREADAEQHLVRGIDELATRLGVSADQRTMWPKLHAANGPGAGVQVSTTCAATGPTADLGFTYGKTEWDDAIRLTSMIVDANRAREVAAALGTLSGKLHIDRLQAVEVVLGPGDRPDVVVWLSLRPT
jgi:hypothetical protein